MKYNTDFLKGLSALTEGNFQKASSHLKNAAMDNKERIEAYYTAGLVFKKLGQFDKALYIIQTILRSDDVDSSTKRVLNVELGRIFFAAGKYDKALKQLEMTSDTDGILLKAKCLRELGRFDDAANTYKSLAKETKMDLNNEIGYCYYRCLKSGLANNNPQCFQNAIKYIPTSRVLRMAHIDQHLLDGRGDKAVEEIETFLQDDLPATHQDMMKFQTIFYDENKFEWLVRHCLKRINKGSSNPFIYTYVISRYITTGSKDKAQAFIDRYIENFGPTHVIARASLALEHNAMLATLLESASFYECSACGEQAKDYTDTCKHCHAFETLKPI
ncbi:MAG: tetratricopeptide repeat protein [Deferribacterales bacterium]